MREWPVPKRWTSPPAEIASALAAATCAIASACASTRSSSALAAVMNLVFPGAVRVESIPSNLYRRLDRCDATPVAVPRQGRSASTRERPQGVDARNGPDRPLLHPHAARPAQPRPRRGRLLALAGARRGVRARERRAADLDRSRGGDRASRDRHGRDRAAEPSAPRGGRAVREARQGGALHEAARAQRGRGEADPRDRRGSRHLRRLPRGSRLLTEDAEGGRGGAGRPDRRRHVGALPRDASRPALRLVLGRGAGRRRRGDRPRLPLHRDHPQLHGQGQPPARGDGVDRHARASDRGRGQRDRADQVRVRRDRPVRGLVDVPRRHGPARRGRRHRGDDLDEPLPPHRLRDVLVGRGRRLRGREGGDGERLAVPGRRRGGRARLRRHVHRHVRLDRRGARAARELLRRLRRQRDHGRGLRVLRVTAVGAGADRRLARRHDRADRAAAPRARRAAR